MLPWMEEPPILSFAGDTEEGLNPILCFAGDTEEGLKTRKERSGEEDLGGRRGKQTKQRQGGVDPAIRFKPHPPIDWRATKIDGGSGRRRIRCGACRLTRDGTEGGRRRGTIPWPEEV